MEMQDVSKEKERNEEGKPMAQVQPEDETDHYEKMLNPSDDVYSEAFIVPSDKTKAGTEKQSRSRGNIPLYPAVCVILGFICLVLLMVVIALSVKLQTGQAEDCQVLSNRIQHRRCQCQQCAPGWRAFDGSCYYFSTTRLSWDQSLQNCTSRGGSLAVINTQDVQTFLAQEGSLMYWIGLRQTGAAWTWVNRTRLRESHWAEAPMDGDCGILRGGGPPEKNWIKASCDSYTYYICQLMI